MINQLQELQQLTAEVEVVFDDAAELYFPPARYKPEGLTLRNSVCGLASNVIAKCLQETQIAPDAYMVIGLPIDNQDKLPRRMQRHVMCLTRDIRVDPTYGQFMTLVGLDINNAVADEAMRSLYPKGKIAVIPRGMERVFGERFADFALDKIPEITAARRKIGERAAWPPEDSCVRMSESEAFETLADIWNPKRYKVFDNDGDAEALARDTTHTILQRLKRAT